MERKILTTKGFIKHSFPLIFVLYSVFAVHQTALGLEKTDDSQFLQLKGNKNILKGIDLLYNREFDAAEALFQHVATESQDKTAGYFYLAMVTWSRMVAGFWSPEIVNEFKRRIDHTATLAKRRIKKGVADSFDYFYLGGALGFLARYKMMEKDWFSSFLVARKAIKALKTCIKMDPDNRDVLLGLGTFDYYTVRLSGALKFLSYFFLHKGDRTEGLRKLHIAAKEAIYSGTESKSVLLHIYLFLEEDCSEALPLARELAEKYDQDPTYRLFLGVACIRLGIKTEYMDTLLYLHIKSQQSASIEKSLLWKRRALYLESINDLFQGRYPEARAKLSEILKLSDTENDPAMIAWPIMKIGLTYDFEGNRKTAKDYYRRVINMKNASGAQFMAQKCHNSPPGKKDPTIGY